MPCEECENNKWRWGESGECQYDSKESCQEANTEYEEASTENEVEIGDGDVDVDWTYNFTEEQMEVLHEEGELLVTVEKEENESMTLLFTYKKPEVEEELEEEKEEDELEKSYAKLTRSMLDDELDEYIDKITNALKKL
tara:strand:+ start:407 stop:823 length:417 start_codon:yes stop_codon:yes gene_type:complete